MSKPITKPNTATGAQAKEAVAPAGETAAAPAPESLFVDRGAVEVLPPGVPAVREPVMLDQYLIARSSSDRRVELLSGFRTYAVAIGRTQATPTEFDALFEQFITKPI